jgi:hypothetical protein
MHYQKTSLRVYAALAIGAFAVSPLASAELPRGDDTVIGVEGAICGPLKSVDGGSVSAEVINEPSGPDYFVKKHIGQPKYEEFTVQFGFGLGRQLYQWIQSSWSASYTRKEITLIQGDQVRTASNCLITETTIPALDTRLQTPGAISVKFAAEEIRAAGGGEKLKATQDVVSRPWLVSGFRLELAGIATTSVLRIESFTVKQTAITDDIGDARDYAREPGKLEFPNLVITVPESASKTWTDWHREFVIVGNNDEINEKSGAIRLLGPDRRELAQIQLSNVGIYKVVPARAADGTKVVVAELYVERMQFVAAK